MSFDLLAQMNVIEVAHVIQFELTAERQVYVDVLSTMLILKFLCV